MNPSDALAYKDLVLNNPQFSHEAQIIVAGGIFIFLLLWGWSKVVRAWKS